MAFDAPLSFNRREFELFSLASPTITPDLLPLTPAGGLKRRMGSSDITRTSNLSFSEILPTTEKHHQAATRLQKVYKSFRTRRRLADCAVLVEQRWWKLMDFAELKRSSISFFDIEQQETAVSRWTRATTRAAKVGKGLSKDERARKLALQHWLEAIDPRHRYGHNLQFYYASWLHCDSNQPFFYWLDIGDGKEVNLERCPRQKLHQQCIKYLGPIERMSYEVAVEDGKFFYRQSGELVDTTHGPEDAKWIFVLSTSKVLYVGQKNKGTFQHSSFLAGGVTLFAGRLVAEAGVLKAVWAHSGHYLPTEENFQELMSFLEEHNVDLTNVKKSPTEEEVSDLVERRNPVPRCSSEPDFTPYAVESAQPKTHIRKRSAGSEEDANSRSSTLSKRLGLEISQLEIPQKIDAVHMFRRPDIPGPGFTTRPLVFESPSEDGYETAEETFDEEDFMVPKSHLFDEDEEEEHDEDVIPKEKIMKRIDSHKGLKSYQLAKQLTSRWTTGAGPRIGCMRDYPLELQLRVLEQTHLTPREVMPRGSTPRVLSRFSSMNQQSPLYKDARTGGSPLTPRPMSPVVETDTPLLEEQ